MSHLSQTYSVNHVVHQLVNFGPLEPRLPTVPHDFGVGTLSNKRSSAMPFLFITHHYY